MNDKGTQGQEDLPLEEYKTLETRLYGELMRSCQRYFTKLRIISIKIKTKWFQERAEIHPILRFSALKIVI